MSDHVQNTTIAAHFAEAARRLMEGDMVDAAAARFSETVFVANLKGDEALENCVFEAAFEAGVGAISLRRGSNGASTPRRANLVFANGSERISVRDCVLWSGDEAPTVLVPFDHRHDFHFGIGPSGLERRPGRPAVLLGEGMSRAKGRLERAASDLRRDGSAASATIVRMGGATGRSGPGPR